VQPRLLPTQISALLDDLHAPPRLVAHLALVHDVACALVSSLDETWPSLSYDRDAIRIGAALHDIGKVAHPEELTQLGRLHEAAGEALLRTHGYPPALARLARTHAQWTAEPEPQLEDLLVALADSWWRGKRDARLESAVCQTIADKMGEPQWQVFITVDEIAADITAGADARLAWQSQHSL